MSQNNANTITSGDFKIHLDKRLGKGGMGEVFEGTQISLDRKVAVKILPSDLAEDDSFLMRFRREAKILAELNDDNIVHIYASGTLDKQCFYAMELLTGKTLREHIDQNAPLTLKETLEIACSTAKALSAAYKKGIIHRDIKPSNIFITEHEKVKVLDFGLARSDAPDVTQSVIIAGSAKYISPEQAQGLPQDIRSDIYSFGCVMYEMITGKVPFESTNLTGYLHQHINVKPVRPSVINPAIPAEFDQIIMKCLEKDVKNRYALPSDLLYELNNLLHQTDTKIVADSIEKTMVLGGQTKTLQKTKRKKKLTIYALAIVLLAVTLAYILLPVEKEDPSMEVNAASDTEVSPAIESSDENNRVADNPPAEKEPDKKADKKVTDAGSAATATDSKSEEDKKLPEKQENIEELRGEALKCIRNLEWEKAKELYSTLIKLDQSNENEYLAQIKKCAEEIEKKQLLDKIERTKGEALNLFNQRKWDEARDKFTELIELDPATDYSNYLSIIEKRKHDEIEQRKKEQRITETRILIETQIKKGDWEAAEKTFEKLMELDNSKSNFKYMDTIKKRRSEEINAIKTGAIRLFEKREWKSSLEAIGKIPDKYRDDEIKQLINILNVAVKAPDNMLFIKGALHKFGADNGNDYEGPRHAANIKDFYIDIREVTVEEYSKFMKSIADSGHIKCVLREPDRKDHTPANWEEQLKSPDKAVVGVDYYDAASYANWKGKRLPTEYEFEFTMKNSAGLSGLDNEIIEWSSSWFKPYPKSRAVNLYFGEKAKVLKGGYYYPDREINFTRRYFEIPLQRRNEIGFRCAMDISR